jgi:hypothetical protein
VGLKGLSNEKCCTEDNNPIKNLRLKKNSLREVVTKSLILNEMPLVVNSCRYSVEMRSVWERTSDDIMLAYNGFLTVNATFTS